MRFELARRQQLATAASRLREEPAIASDRFDWLIDNSEAYAMLVGATQEARESIWICQLAFDPDCRVYSTNRAPGECDTPGDTLLDAILATSKKNCVKVRILLNSTLLLNTKRPLLRCLAGREDAALVEVRGISRFPQLLHTKMVIIDERRAFLMGSPFVNGYWDTPSHDPIDRRRPRRELGGRPIHDVSIGVRGPTVKELAKVFAHLWNGATQKEGVGQMLISRPSQRSAPGLSGVKVVTTEPGGRLRSGWQGSLQTIEALLDGIRRARTLIYVEHQYLSSRLVVNALRRALDREPCLEIILLLNQNPDVTAYRRWQHARLAEAGLLAHSRVGVFALWSTGPRSGSRTTVNQVFVHSKVVIIDDAWAMVGSANLDGASLESYGDDFTGRLARRVFRDVRNFDVSLVLDARLKPERGVMPIRALRERLWMEHLGGFLRAQRGANGPLADWKALASRNVAALSGRAPNELPALNGSFVLPYSTNPTPRGRGGAGLSRNRPPIRSWLARSELQPELDSEHSPMTQSGADAPPESPAGAQPSMATVQKRVELEFRGFVQQPDFPCLGAKSVVRVNRYDLIVYRSLGNASDAQALVADLAKFGEKWSEDGLSAFVAVFPQSPPGSELEFERRLWRQLQLLHEADPERARWAQDVSSDPEDSHFSFSVGGRAFFVVGLHPLSSRLARRFLWPTLVFNPHEQFSRLREQGRFEGFRAAIRARDIALQGTKNPNVADFGERSEARQYSGRETEGDWNCPFHRRMP